MATLTPPRKAAAKPGPARARPRVRAVSGKAGVSLVSQAVDALRRVVLAAPGPGTFLGSEDQLITALGVSRPTFRQASKLLRYENLLTIKRGVGGGFFSESPSGEAVSRVAAIYLNAQGTSLRQLNDVVGPLQCEAARLLAENPDRALRARLGEFLAQLRSSEAPQPKHRVVRDLLAFEQCLGELAGNPAILLVMKVMRDLVRDVRHGSFKMTPARAAIHEDFQTRLSAAILDGDAEMAVLLCRRHGAEVSSWFANTLLPRP
jgi:DNA-binding FadR family transcriptional regulator